jgi:4-alpha-glucanotransferase
MRSLSGIPSDDLKSALGEFLIQCPVYRYYGARFPLNSNEENAVKTILTRLRKSGESKEAVSILDAIFLKKPHAGDTDFNNRMAKFYMRCMQFTGPLMAKGVEDTLMYTFNRFIGHNEVGDSPETFGLTTQEFHSRMVTRQQQWALSMSGTSTHDTKRGEDVRARLNVLTDIGDEWIAKVEEWRELNAALKTDAGPDDNDEYLVYQALVGHYAKGEENFEARIQEYLQKAVREAKIHSNWTTPNGEYESATKAFAVALLDKEKPFWKSFQDFLSQIQQHGMINSLSQVLLKVTLPGVPDVYQGSELWDFSFVDPDNRRAVDFEKRNSLVDRFENAGTDLLPSLWKEDNGSIKLWLLQQLLAIRKTDAGLFTEGDYIPLKTEGKFKEHVFAFARKQAEKTFLFALPLHTAMLCKEQPNFFKIDWEDTRIVLPKEFSGFSDVLSGASIAKSEGLLAKNLFKKFTVAILKGKENARERGAGILAHITSLPSLFGVGDLGPGAKAFADFLHRSGQTYWQLLPLNPTEQGQGYSPYSALSSKAGWPLLISPEALVKEGLLKAGDLETHHLPNESSVDYQAAETVKENILTAAFDAFLQAGNTTLQNDFKLFCEKEKGWLDDFALFMFLKKEHKGLPWYEWPAELKGREVTALSAVTKNAGMALQKIKWNQFIFTKQWSSLKIYCNNRNIKLIGDMPFYVSYDSADVWAAQEFFALDDNGERTGVAGVPPDSFSADGQLWGMPTFKWERMKEEGYRWWIQRLRKNMELFDLTRLDHFRAFAAYWQVPAGEKTARNGTWIPGPGTDFFRAMQKEFGELPFVAEDLGDINEEVLNLRDEFNMPGMKVLQFAFGDDMSQSDYIPHNYEKNFLVYTGTHDNNTTIGWWKTEADNKLRQRVKDYVGHDVNEQNIHSILIRQAYASVANIAVIPVQDVLGLDEKGRMNVPSSANNNWSWRLRYKEVNTGTEKLLQHLVSLYNR